MSRASCRSGCGGMVWPSADTTTSEGKMKNLSMSYRSIHVDGSATSVRGWPADVLNYLDVSFRFNLTWFRIVSIARQNGGPRRDCGAQARVHATINNPAPPLRSGLQITQHVGSKI